MTTLLCKVCGHIEFGDTPDRCPVCFAPRDCFITGTDHIKRAANPESLTDGDKKHIPAITVVKKCGLIPGGGCTDVHVKVGSIEHVMEEKHFITWIDFYIDKKYIARTSLTNQMCHPAAALHLKAQSGTLTAVENCNVHGKWMSETPI